MTVTSTHAYSARVVKTGGDIPLALRLDNPGAVELNASGIPHATGEVTVAVENAMLLEELDPRDNRRVIIEAKRADTSAPINSSTSVLETRSIDRTEPVYGPPRVFNLGIREAIPNRAEGTVALRLASDEALLGDFAQLADDKNPRTYQASLRGVCNYVLGKIGAVLQAGTTDADVTPYWGITNLVTNPSLEVNADGYTAGTNANSPARVAVTFDPPSGFGIRWNTGGIGISYLDYAAASGIRVTAGRWYVLSGYMICSVASTGHGRVHFKNDEGVTIAQAVGASIGVTGSAWARPFVIAQAPAGATTVSIHFGYQATAANRQPHVDAVMFYEGNEVVPYFDGATGDTAFYDYSWSAAAHASASSRRAIVERLPESLVWRAGVSGMAFLETLLKAAGLRLVCDERRRWTLRDADYRGTGNQTYRHAANIETADETLSREDDAWFDAAVYEYSWTDQSGIDQRRVDAFALTGTPTKVLRVELPNTPFPGPGRAESIVRRAQGRGRTVTVSAIPTWTEQTDESLSVLLEGSPIQTGITGSVRFDFGGDTVTVTSRTTDTPAAAWILIPAGQKWNASPVGGTWTGEAI